MEEECGENKKKIEENISQIKPAELFKIKNQCQVGLNAKKQKGVGLYVVTKKIA